MTENLILNLQVTSVITIMLLTLKHDLEMTASFMQVLPEKVSKSPD